MIDHAAILAHIQENLRRRFPIGCRVRLTKEAGRRWPKYVEVTGTVIRHANTGVSPVVLWDGRKTGSGYHPDFLRRARK